MVHAPEAEERLQNWNGIVHLSLLFLEAIAFEPVVFTPDSSYSAFSHTACAFVLSAPLRSVTVWPALTLYRQISSTLNVNFTFVRTMVLSHR